MTVLYHLLLRKKHNAGCIPGILGATYLVIFLLIHYSDDLEVCHFCGIPEQGRAIQKSALLLRLCALDEPMVIDSVSTMMEKGSVLSLWKAPVEESPY